MPVGDVEQESGPLDTWAIVEFMLLPFPILPLPPPRSPGPLHFSRSSLSTAPSSPPLLSSLCLGRQTLGTTILTFQDTIPL